MWSFYQKVETSIDVVTSDRNNQPSVHPISCTCCEVCLENQEMYYAEQEMLLNDQPSSQPAGYNEADFISQPNLANVDESKSGNTDKVLAYESLSDYVAESQVETVDGYTTETEDEYQQGYDACSEDDRDSVSSATIEGAGNKGADEQLFMSPPMQYPDEWDTHNLECVCEVCGVSVSTTVPNASVEQKSALPERS